MATRYVKFNTTVAFWWDRVRKTSPIHVRLRHPGHGDWCFALYPGTAPYKKAAAQLKAARKPYPKEK